MATFTVDQINSATEMDIQKYHPGGGFTNSGYRDHKKPIEWIQDSNTIYDIRLRIDGKWRHFRSRAYRDYIARNGEDDL